MDMITAVLGAASLLIAGGLVIVAMDRKYGRSVLWAMCLIAGGFLVLGNRYIYLITTNDIGRLSIYGTASIGMIALGTIMICVRLLR